MTDIHHRSLREYFRSEKSFDLKVYFFLALIIVWGYYDVSFFIHPLKWDIIDQALPYRYSIGECLKNNIFPYWQPYQQFGVPFYADPASGVWYPIAWAFGYISGYNIYTISIEYLLHIYIASVGFYLLAKNLGLSKWAALISAVCYTFSGFIVGNSQHLVYIISAAWIPLVLNSYINLMRYKKMLYALTTAFFLYMLTTGGYPAFWIILFYHILAIFIIYSIYLLTRKNTKDWKRFFTLNIVTIAVYAVLTLSYFVSIIYNKDAIGRLNSTAIQDVLFSPFSPKCMVSFVAPYAVTGNMEFFNTDFSMANAYIGIVALLFFILYFFQKKSRLSLAILIIGIINLLIAFGGYLPLREFLYHYVPLMNLFRFPSIFRYFTIIAFILIASFSMQTFFENRSKKLVFVSIALLLALFATILVARTYDYLNLKNIITDLAWKFPNGTTILQRIAFQVTVQLGLVLMFVLIYRFLKIKIQYLLLFFVLVDMVFATRLNSPCTMFYKDFQSKDIRIFEKNNFVKGFPVPDKPVAEYSDSTGYYMCYWRNLSSYYKRPAFDGYNSFQINTCERLKENHYRFFKEIKKNKLFYFADTVINKFDSLTALSYGRQGMVFTEDDLSGITVGANKTNKVEITDFSPNKINVSTDCEGQALLVFMQNYNKGWKAKINNDDLKIHRVNLTLNAVVVPPGKSFITFSYKPTPVVIARYVSLFAGVITLLCLAYISIFKKTGW